MEERGVSTDAWLTLLVLLVMVIILARDIVAPSVAVIGSVVVLLVFGIIEPAGAFSGFSNPAPITVAALYVVARAVEKTGTIQPIVRMVLGEGRSVRGSLARVLLPSGAASAFLNNTPIVAMLVPQLTDWADRHQRSVSHFLIPLSFVAMLGGMVTLIGTSTNLVISGLLEAHDMESLGMFELSPVGLPLFVVGVIVIVFLAPLVLPERRTPRRALEESAREFVVGMEVDAGGPLAGKAVSEGNLRNLQGVFLAEIERDGELVAPVSPDAILHGGDRLTFVGRADTIVDLQAMRGLTSREEEHLKEFDTHRHTFFEAVVGAASPLSGKTLKEIGFRGRYQAAVVAIHRAGQRVVAKLGSVRLRPGDTFLLLSDAGFRDRWRDRSPFLLISRIGGTPPAVSRKAPLVALILAAIVVAAAIGIMPILNASLVGAFALVLFGVLTPGEARNAVDLDVILVIAGAFGLAAALEVSGLAELGAGAVVSALGGWGSVGGLLGIVLATVVLTCIITNNAAAVLMFPIAISTAAQLGAGTRAFAVAVAFAASASFLTPIAYQTNTMVYGPGGYRFGDYARLGLPLTVLVVVVTVVVVPLFWPLK
jgi:di/tricarboxylate transporter